MNRKTERKARLIAYYLPQFHPIPENDQWWGNGFTEWTTVAKAKPLFRGHYQPHIPADLGFYDLRVPEARAAQAEMAEKYGIEGFCYWHYWFAGKLLLETPFHEVLKLGEPDFPFCLGWANVSWTGEWAGNSEKVLIDQTYPSLEDHKAHFDYFLRAFCDERYIKVDGKPVLYIHYPELIPDMRKVSDYWRELAHKSGLKGLHLVGGDLNHDLTEKLGFDAFSCHFPRWKQLWWRPKYRNKVVNELYRRFSKITNLPVIYRYDQALDVYRVNNSNYYNHYPLIIPNWDNTPRVGQRGVVFVNSTPDNFRGHLRDVLKKVAQKPIENRIIFAKSWNEWAEGNYLEPDQRFGKRYLEVIREELDQENPN